MSKSFYNETEVMSEDGSRLHNEAYDEARGLLLKYHALGFPFHEIGRIIIDATSMAECEERLYHQVKVRKK